MNWNPTGAAYKVYENLLKNSINKIITVRYYYIDGRSITFAFVWSGQQENYGNSMELKVMLSSELDGLVNSLLQNTAQADPQEQGVPLVNSMTELEKSYGVDKYKIVDYTSKAKEDMGKSKMLEGYNQGSKFYESIQAVAQNNGNSVFPSNIVTSTGSGPAIKCIVFAPYTWDKATPVAEMGPTQQSPDPKQRYGYILGPALIDTITKQSQWQPSQKRQVLTLNVQQQLKPPENPKQGTSTNNAVPQVGAGKAAEAARPTSGASGSSSSNSRMKMRLTENQDGEDKKLLLEEERQCKLSASLFMCPAFTGIKPYDIVFIPNFAGTFMEDWIVTSVEYSQTDGGVTVSIQAARKFALGDFMNPQQGKPWLEKARAYGLVGEGATLENWMRYGWKPGTPAATGNTSEGSGVSGIVGSLVSGFTVGNNFNVG